METIGSLVRHGMQLLAGYLVSKGIIDESMSETIIGLGASVAALVWYFWNKSKTA